MRTLTNEELTNIIRTDTEVTDYGVDAVKEVISRLFDGRARLAPGRNPLYTPLADTRYVRAREDDTY